MTKTPTRLYTVKHKASNTVRLVEATNPNPALSHVARDEYVVEVADAKEAAVLARAGVPIETAGVTATGHVAGDASSSVAAPQNSALVGGQVTTDETTLYNAAIKLVRADGRVSVSLVQSSLQIGFNLACRLIERMEAEGLVSHPDHHGVRSLLPAAA